MVGSLYSQKYKEGKRIMEYDVEILEYLDASNEKGGNRFYPCKMFEITAQYELIKLDDHKIYLKYATTNRPLKWFGKLLLLFSTDKVVIEFVKRVKSSCIKKQLKA